MTDDAVLGRPPQHLDEPLELDPDSWEPVEVYRLMTGLVVPRPIAWVSSVSPDGVDNLAPHSYFAMVAGRPPHIVFSTEGVKDTLTNVRATGEFVVNLVGMHLVEAMNMTAADVPPEHSEFDWSGVTPVASRVVGAPRVREARAHLECRVVQEVGVGTAFMVVGRVVHVHVADEVWRGGRVDPELLDPVLRLAGSAYAGLGEVFRIPRPSFDSLGNGAPDPSLTPRRAQRAPPT